MRTAPRQLHLGAFLFGVGHHVAAWRHPDVDPSAALRLQHYQQLARIAEAGLFDAIFSADTMGLPGGSAQADAALSRNAPPHQFEPLILLAALAGVTERIGLVGTVSTTYLPPYHLARKLASLDHLSGGRAGWNLVTTSSSDSINSAAGVSPCGSRPSSTRLQIRGSVSAWAIHSAIKKLSTSPASTATPSDTCTISGWTPGMKPALLASAPWHSC